MLSALALATLSTSTWCALAEGGSRPSYKAIPASQAENDMPPTAPDAHSAAEATFGSRLAQGGGYLTGSATTNTMVRPQVPTFTAIPFQGNPAGLNGNATADTFGLGARQA